MSKNSKQVDNDTTDDFSIFFRVRVFLMLLFFDPMGQKKTTKKQSIKM